MNLKDFVKAFDSVDRETLWKLVPHHTIPQKRAAIIKNSYQNMRCSITHEGKLTEAFEIDSEV